MIRWTSAASSPGDKLGVPTSQSTDPQEPWYFVAGLTTNISSNLTNNLHYSYLYDWWQYGRGGDAIQLPGLGGALEPLGESKLQNLSPFNVNTQQTRRRFWDGHDNMFRDDVSLLKGNHLLQFGGTYQHNFDWHQRTDNGGGINYQPVYQLSTTSGSGINMAGFVPSDPNVSSASWGRSLCGHFGHRLHRPASLYSRWREPGVESSADAGAGHEHDSLLQRVYQRYVAHEALLHSDLRFGVDPGNAAGREERRPGLNLWMTPTN